MVPPTLPPRDPSQPQIPPNRPPLEDLRNRTVRHLAPLANRNLAVDRHAAESDNGDPP